MLMIGLIILACIATPPILDKVNFYIASKMGATKMASLPAYFINLVVCAVLGLIVVLLPGSWAYLCVSPIALFVIATALIYTLNQAVFNLFVKTYSRARQAIQHGGQP